MVCLSRPYPFKRFKGCLPQNLLSSFLNTLPHLTQTIIMYVSLRSFHKRKDAHSLRKNKAQVPYNELQFWNWSGIVAHSPLGLMYVGYGLQWPWFVETYWSLPEWLIVSSYDKAFKKIKNVSSCTLSWF